MQFIHDAMARPIQNCAVLFTCSIRARPHNRSMSKPKSSLFERLYQPRKPYFWMALAFNALAAVMVLALQSGVLSPLAQWLTALLALANNALGGWAVWRLWRDDSGAGCGDDVAVGVPSGVSEHRSNDEQPQKHRQDGQQNQAGDQRTPPQHDAGVL